MQQDYVNPPKPKTTETSKSTTTKPLSKETYSAIIEKIKTRPEFGPAKIFQLKQSLPSTPSDPSPYYAPDITGRKAECYEFFDNGTYKVKMHWFEEETYADAQTATIASWINIDSGLKEAYWSPLYWKDTSISKGIGYYWTGSQWTKGVYENSEVVIIKISSVNQKASAA